MLVADQCDVILLVDRELSSSTGHRLSRRDGGCEVPSGPLSTVPGQGDRLGIFAAAVLLGLALLLVRLVVLYLAEWSRSKKDKRQKYGSPMSLIASVLWMVGSLVLLLPPARRSRHGLGFLHSLSPPQLRRLPHSAPAAGVGGPAGDGRG